MTQRAVFAALVGVLLAGSAMSSPVSAKKKKSVRVAAHDASACPRFSQLEDSKEKEVTFRLRNECEEPIHCSVSWEVSCPSGGGPGEKHDDPIEIARGEPQSLTASGAVCGNGSWKVSPAQWKCYFKSSDAGTASR